MAADHVTEIVNVILYGYTDMIDDTVTTTLYFGMKQLKINVIHLDAAAGSSV